ncbi:MAG TPA: GNAT family N-acetyltransferase [Thermoanaerobaculia bacterium]|jgi:CelD/BcsL family acetyltransferase involved in cellulose biosynthesis|nr:GNAT family N-acetyltransferase [Thermoanaerobaculia bacterium]
MSVEELTSFEQLQAIEPLWMELWNRDAAATPFQSPLWLLPWFRHFGSGELLTVAVRDNGRLDAIAPFFILRDDDDPAESLGMLIGSGNSDYVDMLSSPDAPVDEVVARLVAADCAVWDLQQLRSISPLLHVPAPPRWSDEIEDQDPCLVLSLDDLADRTSTHFRKKLRYYRRSLEREGRLSIESPTAESLDDFMKALFELHAARWKKRGLPGMLAAEIDQSFHREVARGMLAAASLRMYSMRINDRVVAIFYGFAHHDTVYYYLSGYDPSLEKFSPGTVIVAHAIEQALRDGAKSFDFLRGAEEYKYAWGATDRMNQRRRLIRG